MAHEVINTGFAPNDGQGDTPRDAAAKINRMTTELYALVAGLNDTRSPILRALAQLILQPGVIALTGDGAEIAPIGAAGRQLLALDDVAELAGYADLQPADADLAAIAALATAAFGRSLLTGADAPAVRTLLGLGSAALATLGNGAGNVLQLDGTSKVPVANLPEALLGALRYQSGWNAATNSPALASPPAAATKGFFYVVTTAGTTNLSGITDWKVGDWAVSNGNTWDKIDSSDQVNSVAGLMGTISAADLRTALGLIIGQTVQAQDADLDAIAALATTAYGRGLLALTDAAALRTASGTRIGQDVQAYSALLGSIAGSATNSALFYRDATGNFQPLTLGSGLSVSAGALVAAGGGGSFQPADADLDAIAALTTQAFGRSLLTGADGAAIRTLLGLGTAALATIGTAAGNALQLDGNSKVPVANLPEAILGALRYQAGWNAATNSPALASPPAAATKGFFYVVTTAGTTNLSGVTDWKVGDWAVSNGTTWDKVDSSDQVNSVAGLMGTISAADLRTALGLIIGNTVQGYSALLASIAGSATNSVLFYRDAGGAFAPLALGSGLSISAGSLVAAGSASAPTVDVQVFDVGGTWTKPANAKSVHITCMGAGGGGGGGRKGAAGTNAGGGCGGGGGSRAEGVYPATSLPASLSVTVGAGGSAGAGASAVGDGSPGGFAGRSSVFDGSRRLITAGAGGGGAGGTTTDSASGGGSSGGGQFGGGSGGAAFAAAGFAGQPPGTESTGANGGGAGGGATSGGAAYGGSNAFGGVVTAFAGSGSTSTTGGAGEAGANADNPKLAIYGAPGAGGGGTTATAGGAGGAGAAGGGGGGGGGTTGSGNGGNGGAGGNGRVIITTFF